MRVTDSLTKRHCIFLLQVTAMVCITEQSLSNLTFMNSSFLGCRRKLAWKLGVMVQSIQSWFICFLLLADLKLSTYAWMFDASFFINYFSHFSSVSSLLTKQKKKKPYHVTKLIPTLLHVHFFCSYNILKHYNIHIDLEKPSMEEK